MTLPTTPNDAPEKGLPPQSGRGRRRFIRGVGVAIPVIVTARSPSALAVQCLSPSASASIALLHSRPNRDGFVCNGRSPGFWQEAANPTHPNHWAWTAIKAYATPTTLFSAIFGSGYNGWTLKQVLDASGQGDPYQFGAHLIAAYLNMKSGWVPTGVLDGSDLLKMWNNGSITGLYYSPTPGVNWGVTEIKAFLTTTWT